MGHFKNFILFCCFLSIFSCKVTKNVQKESVESKTGIISYETTEISTQVLTTTKTSVDADTTLVFEGSQVSVAALFQSLSGGDTIYSSQEGVSVKVFYDSLSKTIFSQVKVEPRKEIVFFHQETTTTQIATGNINSKNDVITNTESKSTTIKKEVKRNSLGWIPLVGFLVLVISVGCYFAFKKFF